LNTFRGNKKTAVELQAMYRKNERELADIGEWLSVRFFSFILKLF
jgi:hypothetical protein